MVGLREPVMALAPRLRCELWRRSLAEVVDASVELVLPLAPMGLALWVTGSASVAEIHAAPCLALELGERRFAGGRCPCNGVFLIRHINAIGSRVAAIRPEAVK
jgi:hypothetical protein